MKDRISDQDEGSGVPLFGSWRNAYTVVVAVFICEVGLFYLVSRVFL